MIKKELQPQEFDNYYARYINKLEDSIELLQSFKDDKMQVVDFFSSIPENKLEFRYQPEKWSCKEILQHLIDTERIFMHRCFRIARRDATMLSGFDQNIYISPSNAHYKTLEELLVEFKITRESSINLLESLHPKDLAFIGNANGGSMSARAAAYVIPGHNIWHIEVIEERYLC